MSFDLEKGAGASNAFVQQPTTARLSNFAESSHFPPTYEHHVNENMRNFDSDSQEVKLRKFDDIQDPKPTQRKRKCPTWVWFTVGISILLVISALLGGLIIHYMNKHNSHDDKMSIATRSEETIKVSPLTTTIFVTQTPPTTSTQVVITTVKPSTSTPSIVTVTSTTTASSSESSSTKSTTTSIDSTVTTFSTFIVPAPATTSSTLNPSEAALSSSIAAEMSRNSAKLIPSPITITSMSITTATAVSVSTPPPAPSQTLTAMPGGDINRCGVPGSACNGKREAQAQAQAHVQAQVQARQGFYLGRCGVPGSACN